MSDVIAYDLPSGGRFWFDPTRQAIVSSDDGMFFQIILRSDFGEIIKRILLNIDGLKIQFSEEGGRGFQATLPKNSDGISIWKIGDIGTPLLFYTGHDDERAGKSRPAEERFQILSNTCKFSSREQQDRAIEFVSEALSKFGNSFFSAVSGNEKPAIVEFSDTVRNNLERGTYINN
ncbi:hypothetical protein [Phaeobacter gallaeciensis]|uniref:hypothetical protein n=1 Tax=Phaeobacter gallaeciensis TaxID=60890 RepID=UPI00237FD0CC|nr:hypothetical protein [Phaeobacter gallaeciensis]